MENAQSLQKAIAGNPQLPFTILPVSTTYKRLCYLCSIFISTDALFRPHFLYHDDELFSTILLGTLRFPSTTVLQIYTCVPAEIYNNCISVLA